MDEKKQISASRIIKILHELQNCVYREEVNTDLVTAEDTDGDPVEARNINEQHRIGVLRGIEESKNLIRKSLGMEEKCSWRDNFGDADYDYDTGCGKFRISHEPGKYCKYCGKKIEYEIND